MKQDQNSLLACIFGAIGRGGRVRNFSTEAVNLTRARSDFQKKKKDYNCLFSFTGQVRVAVMLTFESTDRERIARSCPYSLTRTKRKRSSEWKDISVPDDGETLVILQTCWSDRPSKMLRMMDDENRKSKPKSLHESVGSPRIWGVSALLIISVVTDHIFWTNKSIFVDLGYNDWYLMLIFSV